MGEKDQEGDKLYTTDDETGEEDDNDLAVPYRYLVQLTLFGI